jgi:hypothetical protein
LSKLWSVPLLATLVLLPGCSPARVESEHVGSGVAVEQAIKRYYARNAREGNCYNPYIEGFTQLEVLEDTPERLVVHARYFYRDRFQSGGGDDGMSTALCSGFAARTFTLEPAPEGGDVVVAMTGQ